MNKNVIILLMAVVLLASNTVLAVLLYYKKPIAPSVTVFFNGKQVGYAKDFDIINSQFWNNYPHLIVTNEGKAIDTLARLTDVNFPKVVNLKGEIIYRYFFNNDKIHEVDTTFNILKAFPEIFILTDSLSFESIKAKMREFGLKNHISILKKQKMKNGCEKLGYPYFFYLSNSLKIENIYFPRIETPVTTLKYLQFLVKRVGTAKNTL